jgi:hypothetical protein
VAALDFCEGSPTFDFKDVNSELFTFKESEMGNILSSHLLALALDSAFVVEDSKILDKS